MKERSHDELKNVLTCFNIYKLEKSRFFFERTIN